MTTQILRFLHTIGMSSLFEPYRFDDMVLDRTFLQTNRQQQFHTIDGCFIFRVLVKSLEHDAQIACAIRVSVIHSDGNSSFSQIINDFR